MTKTFFNIPWDGVSYEAKVSASALLLVALLIILAAIVAQLIERK